MPSSPTSPAQTYPVSVKEVLLFVHFGDAQLRGSERCLLNLISGLDKDQYDIVLWCNHKELATLAKPLVKELVLGNFYPPFGFNYSDPNQNAIGNFFGLIKDAHALLRRIKPALVLCNSLAPCQWMVPASIWARVPLIAYLHTNYLPKTRLLSLGFGASHMVGVSNFTLERFRGDGFPPRQCTVVYNGVEDLATQATNPLALRQELGINPNDFVVFSLCALVEWKKVDLIIEAFGLLHTNEHGPAVLVIVGDGPCLAQLQAQAKGLRVIFCGWRTDIANLLAAANCVVVAAEREAFALTVTEAASMRVPVVGAKAGGVMEIIIDNETGLFATPGSARSFAESIQKLKDSALLCQRLGGASRLSYESKYRVEAMVAGMEKIIKSTIKLHKLSESSIIRRISNLIYFSARLTLTKLLNFFQKSKVRNNK